MSRFSEWRLRRGGDHDVSTGSERRIRSKRNQPKPMSADAIERALAERLSVRDLQEPKLQDLEADPWPFDRSDP